MATFSHFHDLQKANHDQKLKENTRHVFRPTMNTRMSTPRNGTTRITTGPTRTTRTSGPMFGQIHKIQQRPTKVSKVNVKAKVKAKANHQPKVQVAAHAVLPGIRLRIARFHRKVEKATSKIICLRYKVQHLDIQHFMCLVIHDESFQLCRCTMIPHRNHQFVHLHRCRHHMKGVVFSWPQRPMEFTTHCNSQIQNKIQHPSCHKH